MDDQIGSQQVAKFFLKVLELYWGYCIGTYDMNYWERKEEKVV